MTDTGPDSMLAGLPLDTDSRQFVEDLPAEHRQRFLEILQTAVAQKDERINGAVNNALSVVPLPLRGTVKKMLFS